MLTSAGLSPVTALWLLTWAGLSPAHTHPCSSSAGANLGWPVHSTHAPLLLQLQAASPGWPVPSTHTLTSAPSLAHDSQGAPTDGISASPVALVGLFTPPLACFLPFPGGPHRPPRAQHTQSPTPGVSDKLLLASQTTFDSIQDTICDITSTTQPALPAGQSQKHNPAFYI